mmetsp:Transcript_29599/g.76476  ORF Transcript_29599/g.76476 Transcript_29599/m.76476 type:complete len:228 (-) Transcript_29599:39-722(-)
MRENTSRYSRETFIAPPLPLAVCPCLRLLGSRHWELTRINNRHLLRGLAALAADGLDSLDDRHRFLCDFTEDDMAPIEPLRLNRADEELRAVGTRASIRHGEDPRAGVLELKVLVGKLLAVDRLAAGTVATREVAALQHELRDDTVEDAALVVQRLAALASTLLTRAEGAEVLDRLGDGLAVEFHLDATGGLVTDLDIEENLVGHSRAGRDRHSQGRGHEQREASHY